MEKLSGFGRVFKYTLQHISRNIVQALLIVAVLTITFLAAELFVVAGLASTKILTYFENQPQVTVFFKDEAQPDQILQIKKELEKNGYISNVSYVSKEQAVEIYRSLHADEPELLEFVTPDILPASLEISVNDVGFLSGVADEFESNQFVEKVVYQRDLVNELTRWTDAIRKMGIGFLAVMAFVSLVVIALVVSNNIRDFSKEIEVMKLVGANDWYIRLPFFFDSLIYSVFAATIASVIMYFAMPYIQDFTDQLFPSVQLFSTPLTLSYSLWWGVFAVGSVLVTLISYVSVWRYLKK
ncbi:permease-like cell division protein FtsX [candidate division WWE3 bacterium]|uniref:Cell division protein FtsX n=1 Tax=candidate division WWE3 bacterium TaxID=2053526 RepID=A0A955RRI2_UNCKA|nr:permease-like cell division protein FtsX [candidate division WWE3 bacterium]